MNIFSIKYTLLYIFCLLILTPSQGQIMAPTADRTDTTEYIDGATIGNDPVYFFYTPNQNGHDVGGDLTATYPSGDTANYTWYGYSKTNNAFDSLIYEEKDVVISTFNQIVFTMKDAGYRVHIENSSLGIDTNWHAWVFLNTFDLDNPTITRSTCERMELKSGLDFDTVFYYYDIVDTDSVLTKFNKRSSINWSTTALDTTTSYKPFISKSFTPGFEAPTSPTKFTITVRDTFGHEISKYIEITKEGPLDQANYPYLRAVKPAFRASIFGEAQPQDSVLDEAPLNVQFVNESKNAELYQWIFYDYNNNASLENPEGDGNPIGIKDTTDLIRPSDSILYTYPGQYDVVLYAWGPEYAIGISTQRCMDSIRKYIQVEVDSVFLPKFMNVFTPNDDQKNDKFYFEKYISDKSSSQEFKGPKSIKEFSIKIYSRWGTRVHSFEGKMEDWDGWYGETLGNVKAKTGVYYYVAIYTGYNNKTKKEEGFFHLFR